MKSNSKFCVIDIETKGLSARPERFVFACMYAHNFKKVFYDRKQMVKYLLSPKNPYKYIFAHNAEFDFTILFDNIILNLDNSALFVGSTFVKAINNKKHFCNSLTILKTSVEELGKNLGIEKQVLHDKFKNWKEGDPDIIVTPEDIEYCYRDCEIVYSFLEKIFNITGKIKFTIASCAMEIFTKQFLNRKLKKNPLNEKFRNSYYGGRVECFRFGKINPIYKYDVNSIYPYVCVNMYFPDFNKVRKGRNNSLAYFQKFILHNYEGCVQCEVEHKKNFVGVLPYRRTSEIIFPYGVYTAWYNFNELRTALSTGLVKIKKVIEYVYAPRIQFTELREYMLTYYKLKNETTGAEKLINKFLLNALTGKFAQKDYGKKTYFPNAKEAAEVIWMLENSGVKYKTHTFSEEREDLFIEVFNTQKEKKVNWNIPAISSYITSEARIYMLPFFLANQNHVCYTDTDSLVLTRPLSNKYISETILGMFKKEQDNEINIIGNKHYSSKVKGRTKYYIKGVSKRYRKLTLKEYNEQMDKEHKDRIVTKGKSVFLGFNKMIRTKEALRNELHAGAFVEVVKHLANDYTKRNVSTSNKTTALQLIE